MGKGFRSIRGVHDGMPLDVARWRHIETAARSVCERYGFAEVRLPVLEMTELFVRSIGEDTDIVSKEMYRFTDRSGDDLCLRPEGTAGAVRAYLQAGLHRAGHQRWYYFGPMFRRERPQKGRLRQFQQIGVEWMGPPGPAEDAEVLALARDLLEALSLAGLHCEVNSLGCPACRPGYRGALLDFLHLHAAALCSTCRERIDKNPMRVLDCKVESCKEVLAAAPKTLEHLCTDCLDHFKGFERGLEALKVPYSINARIVRGLDYYTRTAFEITCERLGAQSAVIAGGRYDGLIGELGGPDTPAIGFALGLERLAMLLPEAKAAQASAAVVALGEEAQVFALQLAQTLRRAGVATVHLAGGSAKALFRRADREGVSWVLVAGSEEMQAGEVTVKNMRNGSQQRLTLAQAVAVCQGDANKAF